MVGRAVGQVQCLTKCSLVVGLQRTDKLHPMPPCPSIGLLHGGLSDEDDASYTLLDTGVVSVASGVVGWWARCLGSKQAAHVDVPCSRVDVGLKLIGGPLGVLHATACMGAGPHGPPPLCRWYRSVMGDWCDFEPRSRGSRDEGDGAENRDAFMKQGKAVERSHSLEGSAIRPMTSLPSQGPRDRAALEGKSLH